MSNLRNDHVALSILGVKGHRYGMLRVLVGSRVENTTQLSIGKYLNYILKSDILVVTSALGTCIQNILQKNEVISMF